MTARERRRDQRGQALVVFALAVVFLIGIAGLAIEGGLVESDRRFEQAITDGAALAGAHHLSKSSTSADYAAAEQAAVNYVVDALWGGAGGVPTACNQTSLYSSGGTLPAACDPSATHSVSFQAPYPDASHPDQILVRVDHTFPLNLAAAVGAGSTHTASRSVARSFTGPGPFTYAVYATGDMTTNGNTNTSVEGNVFVTGCINMQNADSLTVTPKGTQAGTVEVYQQVLNNQDIPGAGGQVWNHGQGTGCNANVTANSASGQWGAAGHVSSATENCGISQVPSNFTATCPAGEPPVSLVPVPNFSLTDISASGQPCNATTASPGTFTTVLNGAIPVASPGCYTACASSHGGSISIPANTTFLPGLYAFVGNGTLGGCDVTFSGSAGNVIAGGDGHGGVTFVLYNGASLCASSCGTASGSGLLTFNAPTSGPNFGILIYNCGTTPCGTLAGNVNVKATGWTVNWTGLIYDPGGDCDVSSNATNVITGQLICRNVTLQGGAISLGTGVVFGGNGLPTPEFLASLIE